MKMVLEVRDSKRRIQQPARWSCLRNSQMMQPAAFVRENMLNLILSRAVNGIKAIQVEAGVSDWTEVPRQSTR